MPRKTFTFEGRRYDITAKTEDELYEKIALKKLELKEGKLKEQNILVKDYCKKWFETFKEPYVGAHTVGMYDRAIKHINSYIGHLQMKKVTSSHIQKIITSEYNMGKSKSSIDKDILTLRQVFKQACLDKVIRDNPTLAIQRPKMQEGRRRALTDDERKAVMEVSENHRYGLWIRVMLFMGLRPEETALLKGYDVDTENRMLHVRGTKSEKADRYLPIPNTLIDDLSKFTGDNYILITLNGNPLSDQCRQRRWRAFKRDLDIHMGAKVYRNQIIESVIADGLTMYCLRHTYGTDGQAAGIPIDILADLMGHEDISTTRKYYIHENKESKEAARKAFEEYYKTK